MEEEINYWSEIEGVCPLDISRVKRYYTSFMSNIPSKITLSKLDQSKESLFDARSNLDSMIVSLVQLLYDKDILKGEADKILYAWLTDNLGRFMRRLDEQEEHLIVKFDEPNRESRVGISRLSSYSKLLKTATESLIYETLLKSTREYNSIEEGGKIEKEPRTFLYILFQVFQVTLSVLGGLTREKTGGINKRGVVQTIPTSWQSLMTRSGEKIIKKGYEEDSGIDVGEFEDTLQELNMGGEFDEEEDIRQD